MLLERPHNMVAGSPSPTPRGSDPREQGGSPGIFCGLASEGTISPSVSCSGKSGPYAGGVVELRRQRTVGTGGLGTHFLDEGALERGSNSQGASAMQGRISGDRAVKGQGQRLRPGAGPGGYAQKWRPETAGSGEPRVLEWEKPR